MALKIIALTLLLLLCGCFPPAAYNSGYYYPSIVDEYTLAIERANRNYYDWQMQMQMQQLNRTLQQQQIWR